MRPLLKYRSRIGLIAVLAVIFANSGFTAVLYNCTMQTMQCCVPEKQMSHDICGQDVSPATGASLKSDLVCHSSKVVGGVTTSVALLEKERTFDQKKAITPVISTSAFYSSFDSSTVGLSLRVSSTDVFPQSVEKYVLFASLLI